MDDTLTVLPVTGDQALPFIPALARLRIAVFRDFPYLYDGSLDYEERYLRTCIASPEGLVVVVTDRERVVGASTGVPLDAFWTRRGYKKQPGMRTTMTWKDLDEAAESPKPMVFWMKTLEAVGP